MYELYIGDGTVMEFMTKAGLLLFCEDNSIIAEQIADTKFATKDSGYSILSPEDAEEFEYWLDSINELNVEELLHIT